MPDGVRSPSARALGLPIAQIKYLGLTAGWVAGNWDKERHPLTYLNASVSRGETWRLWP